MKDKLRQMKTMFQLLKAIAIAAIYIVSTGNALAQDTEVFIQMGHTGGITVIDVSPDGRYALSGSMDDTIKLWEIATGKEVRTFTGHGNPVNDVSFSPDGNYVVSGSNDGTVKLWDVSTGREIHTFRGPAQVSAVAFSPDGRHILSGSWDKSLKLWEISTGQAIRTFTGHNADVTSVIFSPDGQYALSGSQDTTLRLWNVSTGRETRTFTGQNEKIENVAISPDGRHALSGGEKGSLMLWEMTTGRQVRSFSGHDSLSFFSSIQGVGFSPDGKYAISGSMDNTIRLWEVSTGQTKRTFENKDKVTSVSFTPDGQHILSGSLDKIKLWEASTGREIRTFTGHSVPVNNVAYSPDGRYLLSGSGGEKVLKLWEVSTGREVRTIRMENRVGLASMSYSPAGRHILTGGFELLTLWDASTGSEIYNFIEPKSGYAINDLAFSPDESYILTGGRDKGLRLWEVSTGQEVRTFTDIDDGGSIHSVAYSPGGQYVLSTSSNLSQKSYLINLWEVSTGRKLQTFTGHKEYVTSVIFSPNGHHALSASADNTLKLWDISTGREIRTFTGHRSSIYGVSISPDGRYALSGSWDKTLKLWEISTGREVRTFSGHIGWIYSVAFSPDGQYAISGSRDGTLRIWEAETGREMARLISFTNDEWVVITPEGYYDASENGAEFLNVRVGNEVFPMDNFFDTYYRPDIVRAKLAGEDITPLIDSDIRNITALPPAVRFITPEGNTTSTGQQLTLTTEITDRGGGIDEVRLTHNGKVVSGDTRGLKVASGQNKTLTPEFTVTLLPGENTFQLTAFGAGQRIESNPAELLVKYEGTVATSDLYVLAVGLNEYKNTTLNLNYGRPDAEAFTEAIKRQSADIFQSVNVTTLYDGQATRAGLQSSFEDIIASAQPQDTFLFFYAGHGVMSEPESDEPGDFYMALSDVVQLYGNNAGLEAEGISAVEITELTRRIPARKQMIVLDACQSGGAVQTFAMRGAAEQKAIMQLARSAGLVVLASTGTEQYATEFQALGHGVFTYALLNGLNGNADGGSKDGKITVKELEAFINDRVPALTTKHHGQAQYPNSYTRGQDFPLVVVQE